MSKSTHNKTRRTAVVMAGVAATALAAGGVEIANAASGAPAITSGVIYACYSNTTKALSQTTKAAGCKTGFTELSWNAKGPQGPPGAIADFTAHKNGSVPISSKTVVASVKPTAPGMYNVTTTEQGRATPGNPDGSASWGCQIVRHTSKGSNVSPVPAGGAATAAGVFANAAGTGAVFGGPSSPIELLCSAATVSTFITQADMTAVRVSSVNGAAITGKPAHPRIMNHFILPRHGSSAARPARSQAHR